MPTISRAPRLRATMALLLAGMLAPALAQQQNPDDAQSATTLKTETIVSSSTSTDCLNYKVVGICYWLFCTQYSCSVRTSTKVRHYIPDAVVSSYANTGENPWEDVRDMSPANDGARGGRDGTTNNAHENNLARFKNADVIGHPGGTVFSEFAGSSGYTCQGAGTAFMPYLLSTLDTLAWRANIPESFYIESWIPGMREVSDIKLDGSSGGFFQGNFLDNLGGLFGGNSGAGTEGNSGTEDNSGTGTGTGSGLDTNTKGNTWGSVYPRGGFLHQTNDYKAAAVVAQRAGDVVTRNWQAHVYWPLLAKARDGYWPAGGLIEGEAKTGKWQELIPTQSDKCAAFPHQDKQVEARRGDYAWALWRPYACCERKGQIFLGSVDFDDDGAGGNTSGGKP
jgi:hypothetical protein